MGKEDYNALNAAPAPLPTGAPSPSPLPSQWIPRASPQHLAQMQMQMQMQLQSAPVPVTAAQLGRGALLADSGLSSMPPAQQLMLSAACLPPGAPPSVPQSNALSAQLQAQVTLTAREAAMHALNANAQQFAQMPVSYAPVQMGPCPDAVGDSGPVPMMPCAVGALGAVGSFALVNAPARPMHLHESSSQRSASQRSQKSRSHSHKSSGSRGSTASRNSNAQLLAPLVAQASASFGAAVCADRFAQASVPQFVEQVDGLIPAAATGPSPSQIAQYSHPMLPFSGLNLNAFPEHLNPVLTGNASSSASMHTDVVLVLQAPYASLILIYCVGCLLKWEVNDIRVFMCSFLKFLFILAFAVLVSSPSRQVCACDIVSHGCTHTHTLSLSLSLSSLSLSLSLYLYS